MLITFKLEYGNKIIDILLIIIKKVIFFEKLDKIDDIKKFKKLLVKLFFWQAK
jgi:hypothetical protein